ncbi:MAG: glycoside hydrolase family 31 protein [Bacilli bacterium]
MNDTSAAIHPDQLQLAGEQALLSIGPVLNAYIKNDAAFFLCERATVAIWLGDGVFRIKISRGEPTATECVPLAHSLKAQPLALVDEGSGYGLIAGGGGFKLTVDKTRFAVHAKTLSDGVICADVTGGVTLTSDDGIRCEKAYAGEPIYGLGEKTGYLNKANSLQSMWNTDVYAPHVPEIRELYVSVPVFYVVGEEASYGIFLNNPGKTTFSFTDVNSYNITARTGDFDYYCFFGPDMKSLIGQYTSLTGRAPQPPRYALGYHQSRYSYESEAELRELATEFRARQIPCDALYLDIHYMDGYRVFTWHPDHYAAAETTIRDLAADGFRVIPIVDPGVKKDEDYSVYQQGRSADVFCAYPDGAVYTGNVWPGESAFPDFTEARIREWWGDLHKRYTDVGICGIWNDMNEPAVFSDTKTMDVAVMHQNDGAPLPHGALHNAYGHYMSQATYEGLARLLDGQRPFVLTRAGYAGTQRYAAVWTGDNRSFWEHLTMTIPMLLNMGLSGLPFAGADVGGFAFDADGLLLTRWMQMAAFTPFFRNHSGMDAVRQEPWQFGPVYEAAIRKAIERRYTLLPHLYSLFYEHRMTGLPVMRALALEFPDDRNTRDLCDSFLLGRNLLVAPIYRPDGGVRSVYLPDGVWYDERTDVTYSGRQHIVTAAALDEIPTFIRAGAIIAQQSPVQHTGQSAAELTIHVYLGDAGEYMYYDDDGLSFAYENGSYKAVAFKLSAVDRDSELAVTVQQSGYRPAEKRTVRLAVHGAPRDLRILEKDAQTPPAQRFTQHTLIVDLPDLLDRSAVYTITHQRREESD